jgi:hypothetical protein
MLLRSNSPDSEISASEASASEVSALENLHV